MFLETCNDVLKNSEKDVGTDFSVSNIRWRAGTMEEGKELGPGAILELDGGDSSDNTSRRMTNNFSSRKMNNANSNDLKHNEQGFRDDHFR